MIKNYGFIAPVIEKKHFVLGGAYSLPEVVLQEDGQWDKYLPKYEPQFGEEFDSYGCTVWGTENAIEILEKRLFGHEKNYSERHIYILSGIRPPGGDPHKVADTIFEYGLIDDSLLPITKTFDEFIQPNPMTRVLEATGKTYRKYRAFGHQWVFTGDHDRQEKINRMMKELTFSPLGVSVTAWNESADGIYRDNGKPNTHWCVCYGYTDKGWKIFDSYDQSEKIYSFDSEISYCKRYHLAEVFPEPKKRGFFAVLVDLFRRIFRI